MIHPVFADVANEEKQKLRMDEEKNILHFYRKSTQIFGSQNN